MSIKTKKGNPHIGSTLEDLLKEDGLLEEASALAAKKKIVRQLRERMDREKISVSRMAAEMHTSRMQINRLLDPKNHNVTLTTLQKAAAVVGRKLRLELI